MSFVIYKNTEPSLLGIVGLKAYLEMGSPVLPFTGKDFEPKDSK